MPRLCSVTPRAISRSSSPGESLVEERDRLLELRRRGAEVRQRGREVMERAGTPPRLVVGGKVSQRGREQSARPVEVRRRPRASEENGEVMEKPSASARLPERRGVVERPEVVGERPGLRGALCVPQLLLRPEPVAVGSDGIRGKRVAEVPEQLVRRVRHPRYPPAGVSRGR